MIVEIQGKWSRMWKLVNNFTQQGWYLLRLEPDEKFQFTEVTLTTDKPEDVARWMEYSSEGTIY